MANVGKTINNINRDGDGNSLYSCALSLSPSPSRFIPFLPPYHLSVSIYGEIGGWFMFVYGIVLPTFSLFGPSPHFTQRAFMSSYRARINRKS